MKIVIIDNKYTHEKSTDILLGGIITLFNNREDTELVAGFNDINDEVIKKLSQLKFDIILLDIDFLDDRVKGIKWIQPIKAAIPNAKVIIFSITVTYKNIKNSLVNKADGFFDKVCDEEELINGLNTVLNGQNFICVSSTSVLINRIVADELTEMDIKILTALSFDPSLSNQRIEDMTLINRVIVGERLNQKLFNIKPDKQSLGEWARKNIFTSRYFDEIKDFISMNNSLERENQLRDCPLKKCILNDFDSLWD